MGEREGGAHTGALAPSGRTTFGLGVGSTNLDLEWKDGRLAFAWMTQQPPTFGKPIDDSRGAGGRNRPRRRGD